MTMADIARHAEVSRATLYRRWPNVQAVVAALMTREWTTALVSAFQPDSVDGRSRLVEGVVEVVAKTRTHPLMRKIIELDPEFLTPYLLERRGSSTVAHLALVKAGIEAGQADGSIRARRPGLAVPPDHPGLAGVGGVGTRARRAEGVPTAGRGAAGDADEVPDAMIAVGNASLNAARRTRELDWLETTGKVDVLVIGGGVTGVGVALDAAARGLTVALVEKHDLAFGTSRWSSKLVHGGLRYLASGHVAIAYESAVERGILMKTTAPHLVHAVPQVAPWLPQARIAQAAMLRGAFLGGDVLRTFARTSDDYLPHSRRISSAEILRYAPTLRPEGLRGGFLTWDGQLYDDARLVVAIARTAASYGARVITRCSAEQVTGSRGAVLVDQLSSCGGWCRRPDRHQRGRDLGGSGCLRHQAAAQPGDSPGAAAVGLRWAVGGADGSGAGGVAPGGDGDTRAG